MSPYVGNKKLAHRILHRQDKLAAYKEKLATCDPASKGAYQQSINQITVELEDLWLEWDRLNLPSPSQFVQSNDG